MEEKIIQDFKSEIDKVSVAAFQSEKGGDENWNHILESYGVQPLTQSEKEMLLNSQMKIVKGAFPIELRRVYEVILMKYSAANNPAFINTLNSFDIEKKVFDYYQKIKPFTGLGDIFKNASVTLTKYSDSFKGEKQQTMKCKNCGAPRLEEMQYDKCLF